MPGMQLSGARILITGASRGLGAALAVRVARRGGRVALVARSEAEINALAAELGGDAYTADLAHTDGLDELVGRVAADGPIDVLVNNAGVDLTGALTELAPERIEQLIMVNLLAPMLLSRAVIPGMLQRRRGHIVNVSSLSGTNTIPGVVPYSTSKAGLTHFTACLRAELKGTPITTTLAELGPVESTMMDSLRGHEPTNRALRRLAKLRLVVDLDMDEVADALADAIESDRRHLRLPHRDALFPLLSEAPRRMTEWLLTGVDAQ
jgi:short-subunit dehydrogenase